MRLLCAVVVLGLWGCASIEASRPGILETPRAGVDEGPVSVAVSVDGRGVVLMEHQSAVCGRDTCLFEVKPGAEVSLEASADPDHRFIGWEGSCSGNSPLCRFSARRGELAVARFGALEGPGVPLAAAP